MNSDTSSEEKSPVELKSTGDSSNVSPIESSKIRAQKEDQVEPLRQVVTVQPDAMPGTISAKPPISSIMLTSNSVSPYEEDQSPSKKIGPLNQASAVEPLDISIHDISYTVEIKDPNAPKKSRFKKPPKIDKLILQNITGCFRAGRMTAVMGASGAGKTSLLNVLAGEVSSGRVDGELTINGSPIQVGKQMKTVSGFVFQDDVILETMTVKEAITMSALLRLPKTTAEATESKVQGLLKLLRLTKCANTIIGSTTVKGISGGERKRTALAMEMTSGLDTFTAYNVCDILKTLARTGRTIIATIHQPSSDIFFLFDDLCLLAEGRVLFWGPVKEVIGYFDEHGYKCPLYSNPADFLFMSVLNVERPSQKKEQIGGKLIENDEQAMDREKERIFKLLDSWEASSGAREAEEAVVAMKSSKRGFSSESIKFVSSFWTQCSYLFKRAGKNAIRNKFIIRVRFFQVVFVGLLVGLIFLNSSSKPFEQQIQNINGALFFVSLNMFMSSTMGVLSIFATEKPVFIREHTNGFYSIAAYFLTKTIVELPHQIIFPVIFSAISYWMIGLNPQPSYAFLVYTIVVIFMSICGTALGIFLASLFSDITVALAATPLTLLPLIIFSGLFVNNDAIPVYFDWIKYLSPMKYGFEALIKIQYQEWAMYTQVSPNTYKLITGDQMVSRLGYNVHPTPGELILILFAMYIGLVLLAYIALRTAVNRRKA